MNRKGEATTVALCIFGVIAISFIGTVLDGTFKKQVQKIKDAHNAPITVDK